MKKWNQLWKDFDKLFDGLDDAMADFASSTTSTSSGMTYSNNNGDIVINGKIKSLKVNGKVIKLDGKL